MKYKEVRGMMESVERFCKGEATLLEISQAIGESYNSIMTLFTMTGIADTLGNVTPGIEPWRVVETLNMLYLMRCDKLLRGNVMSLVEKRRAKGEWAD
jgi:hypothetical protein